MPTRLELIAARKRAGLTQQTLGQILGISYNTVGRLERGDDEPLLRTAQGITAAINERLRAKGHEQVTVDLLFPSTKERHV